MIWAQHLTRVFGIDIETCSACGAATVAVGLVKTVLSVTSASDAKVGRLHTRGEALADFAVR